MNRILDCIEERFGSPATEMIPLSAAGGRFLTRDLAATGNMPVYDEALRDGYAIAIDDNPADDQGKEPSDDEAFRSGKTGEGMLEYVIDREIAAGCSDIVPLRPGYCHRIFTGGVVPAGVDMVVPFEECKEEGDRVVINLKEFAAGRNYIKRKGAEVRCGERLVERGERVCSDHITMLASIGIDQVPVARRPKVAYYCTGNELVTAGERLGTGLKKSLNGWVLSQAIVAGGGLVERGMVLGDDRQLLVSTFVEAAKSKIDLVITTGGMGPGKYDLVKSSFVEAGGDVVVDFLPMRPGKSLLFGTIEHTAFLGLPGPPPAVRTLANELVGPILKRMQGANRYWPEKFEAQILHDLRLKRDGVTHYKSGVYFIEGGKSFVRQSKRLEPVTCYIVTEPGRRLVKEGEMVTVHLRE
ncbi:molybdopterin molybdotransferase MoeA [Desulforhopalus singaporensis]|uniref:Molybdopterin molybdenumtransferase n=1 Tax=Desulforhopalus singaporensis TaxID=91360 RepID=A0A1H0JMT7_9BACT|nr:molybdopterin molybdotransferase MoeA [Desulforhopalus singaporensis]SDO44924.1 molybdopterin molybdotransferase [Desulforhopalus singaporensis]